MDTTWKNCRRNGFSLVESLASVGIVFVLLGLILPAVQTAREAARKIECSNRLKQWALAVHQFASNRDGFPSSITTLYRRPYFTSTGDRPFQASVHCQLLPYVEERKLFDSLNLDVPNGSLHSMPKENHTVASTSLKLFLCPSEASDSIERSGYEALNYRANFGLGEYRQVFVSQIGSLGFAEINNGAFGRIDVLPLSAFADGMSHTMVFSEKNIGSDSKSYSPDRDWIDVGLLIDNPSAEGWSRHCSGLQDGFHAVKDAGLCWLLPGVRYSGFFASASPNSIIPDCGFVGAGHGSGIFAARGNHVNGVNVAMADGSIRWVSSTVSTVFWRSLGTRDGRESISGLY